MSGIANKLIDVISQPICDYVNMVSGLNSARPQDAQTYTERFVSALNLIRQLPEYVCGFLILRAKLGEQVFKLSAQELVELASQGDATDTAQRLTTLLCALLPRRTAYDFHSYEVMIDNIKENYLKAVRDALISLIQDEIAVYNNAVRSGVSREVLQVPSRTLDILSCELRKYGRDPCHILDLVTDGAGTILDLARAVRTRSFRADPETLLFLSRFPQYVRVSQLKTQLAEVYMTGNYPVEDVLKVLCGRETKDQWFKYLKENILDTMVSQEIDSYINKRAADLKSLKEHQEALLRPLGINLGPTPLLKSDDSTKYVLDNHTVPRDRFDVMHNSAFAGSESSMYRTIELVGPRGSGKSHSATSLLNHGQEKDAVFVVPSPDTPFDLHENLDSANQAALRKVQDEEEDEELRAAKIAIYVSSAYRLELAARLILVLAGVEKDVDPAVIYDGLRGDLGKFAKEKLVPLIRSFDAQLGGWGAYPFSNQACFVLDIIAEKLKETVYTKWRTANEKLKEQAAASGSKYEPKYMSVLLFFHEADKWANYLKGMPHIDSRKEGNMLTTAQRTNVTLFPAAYASASSKIGYTPPVSYGGKDFVIYIADELRPASYSEIMQLFTEEVPLVSKELFDSVEVDKSCGTRFGQAETTLNCFMEGLEAQQEKIENMSKEEIARSFVPQLYRTALQQAESKQLEFYKQQLLQLTEDDKLMLHLLYHFGRVTSYPTSVYFGGSEDRAHAALEHLLNLGFCHFWRYEFYIAEPLIYRFIFDEFIRPNFLHSLKVFKFWTSSTESLVSLLTVMLSSSLSSNGTAMAKLLGNKIANLPEFKNYELDVQHVFRPLDVSSSLKPCDDFAYHQLRTTGLMSNTLDPTRSQYLTKTITLQGQKLPKESYPQMNKQPLRQFMLAVAERKASDEEEQKEDNKTLALAIYCDQRNLWLSKMATSASLVRCYEGTSPSREAGQGILRILADPFSSVSSSSEILDKLMTEFNQCNHDDKLERIPGIANAARSKRGDTTVILGPDEFQRILSTFPEHECRALMVAFGYKPTETHAILPRSSSTAKKPARTNNKKIVFQPPKSKQNSQKTEQ